MKDSGGNNEKNAFSYKKFGLVLVAVLVMVFFAFGGWNKVQSAIVDLQKRLAGNEQIDGKERTDNGDGTYKLSLSVTGGETQPQLTAKANVLVIYDVSGSMKDSAYKYTAVANTDTGSERYGLVDGNYVQLERHWQSQGWGGYYYYTYNGTRYTGTRYSKSGDGERGAKAEKVVYDFATALSTYNNITAGTVNMAMVTFSSNNHGNNVTSNNAYGTESNATWFVYGNSNSGAWTTNISNITNRLSSNGTSRSLTYGGGTNWEAAMQRGKSVVNALADDRKNEPTYVIFVTDGAPTFRVTEKSTTWHDGNQSGTTTHGRGRSSDDDVTNYYYAADDAKAIQDIGTNVNFYGIYAYGDEGDLLDDLVNYAYTGTDRTRYGTNNSQDRDTWSLSNPVENYYNASDTTALQGAISDIFDDIVETLGVGEVTINDGTTSNVETTSGEISHLLNVDANSFTYGMSFPVTAVSGEEDTYTITRKNNLGQNYSITLTKNEDGSYQASWGTNSVRLEGKINLGKFEYTWTEANEFYNVAPPAASYNTETGQVEWKLPRETVGTLLDDVKYTVYFDVYPSQYTYDTVARIKNATDPQAEYDKLDANEKKYLKLESNGEVTLETNKEATLTYTDNRNGNTTPTTKTYKNPPRVVTDSSRLDVEKVWLNKEDKKFVPDNLSVKMELVRDNVDTGIELTLNKNGDWTDDVAIATGLMRTKVVDGKTVVEVLDSGHDYTLKETSIEGNIKDYQWELELETVHPMIINGQLTTLVEVPSNEIPSGMTSSDQVYTHNNHTFYRFNGKVYYDKVVPTTGQDQTNAKLNAYNIRKSNFNFTKKVEGDPVGGEFFNFTFKVNDANIDEANIPADATEKELADNYSVWFSVCDSNKLAAMGKSCEDSDAWQYYEKDLTTSATPEEGDTGYYYAPDNTNITLSIQDGWNVRVTNIGTGSTYNITEADPTSPFELTNIDGNVLVSVPELPANAIETSDGVYDVNGVEYRRVTETDAAGIARTVYQYTYEPETNVQNRTISGTIVAPNNTYAVTYVNNYPKTHLTVTKDWHVADSAKKPVNVTLYRSVNGGAKQKVTQTGLSNPVTLNASNNWTYNFKDLDLYDANENVYDYFVEEDELDGNYTTTYSGKENIVVSATDIPENVDEVRAVVSITGQQASSNENIEVILNKDNNWKYIVANKDYLNEDGTVKTVTVTSNSTATIHYALTNRTNTIVNEEFTTVEGQKTWDDAENQDNVRPESITINLLADGVQKYTKVVKSSDNNWSWSWENLPKYKATTVDGKTTYVEIVYTVTESHIQYYEGKITEDTDYSFTNTHTPFKSTITITKEWHDENNRDGIRPTSINVILQDSTGLILTDENNKNVITLTAADNWTKTIEVQRKYAGSDVTYTVKEVGVVTTDYTATISSPEYATEETTKQDRVITLNLDNSHTPETVELSGEKTWDDADNQDGLRPESITVTLYADGSPVEGKTVTVTPDKDNHWTYNFGFLPRYKAGAVGVPIDYTVREDPIAGYTASYNDGTNLNISNKHDPEITSFVGEKTWSDADNQDGIRPKEITVQLLADGSPVEGKTVTISADENGNWPQYSFGNLPKYKNTTLSSETASEIVYTVTDNVSGYVASKDSINLTNTHIPETVDVEGEKIWEDANNQDGKRPQSITVQLVGQVLDKDGETVLATVDTTGKTAVLSDEAGWTYKFEGLQKNMNLGGVNNPDVREITYTVTDSVDGYTTTSEGYDVKNTHVPETVEFNGLKDWVDNNNQDGKRPESITIRLTGTITKDGQTIPADHSQSITLTAENATEEDNNKWAYSFDPAPKYQDGIEINYTITEDEVPDYTSTGVADSNGTITNTHIPGKTSVSGSKTWNDANNQDGKRPEFISITLTGTVKYEKDGKEVTEVVRPAVTKTVTATDNWSWSWPELDKYDNGHEIIYTISETQVPEYNEPEVNGYNVTNTHTPETTKVEGKKTWTDADNQDGLRPESIDITLSAVVKYTKDGQEVTETARPDETKTVKEADGWSWSWDPLPKYYQGHEIEYTITEGAVNYYKSAVTGYNVENIHTPFETQLTVIKDWKDGSNQDGLRPAEVKFKIVKDGVAIDQIITLNEGNNWTYTAEHLPRKAEGKDIVYSVEEITQDQNYKVSDYKQTNPESATNTVTEVNDNQIASITVTNEHTPAVVDVNGSKEWDDDGDRDGIRPTSIKITLTGTTEYEDENGNKVTETVKDAETKTVTAADNWSWSWPDLPKFNKGHEITYTISEEKVPGYNDPEVDGYNVKNTHVPDETSVTITKVWSDDNNRDLLRPTQVLITLYANDAEYGQYPVTINDATSANEWAVTIDHLPLRANGQVITYTAKEKVVSESETDVPAGYTESHSGTTVTNTHIPEPTQISGKKVWKDDGDRDGKRPASITINVYDEDDKTTIVKSQTVSGNNTDEEWSYTITGLNKYKNVNGERKTINYVVDEVLPAGYSKDIDGTTITNTYNTEKKNIPVSKTWVDEKGENYRPTSITVNLLADGVKVDETVLSDENEWKHTFENLPVNKNHGTGTVTYTVEEVETQQIKDYYNVTYPETGEDEGLVIVNTIKDLSKEIPVVKVWDDENNRDNVRPTSITFTLKGTVPNETDPVYTDSITISTADVDGNDANRWVSKFTNVPIFHEGTWITYTVEESGVDTEMYPNTTNVTAADGTITLTNSHSHLLKDIVASKAWDDNDDNDGKRPESVKITLYADGVEQETLEATEGTDWKVTFKNYPVNREGKVGDPIEYTVAETDENIPEGYEPSVDGYTITNSHEPATITYKVTKNWEDFDNNDGKRPDFITVRLVGKVGDTVVKEEVMDVYEINAGFENEPWTYAFTNLPKYYNKELVQYTLTEDKVDLYETEKITFVENTEETTEITNEITNSHDKIPYNENGEITVNKYWYDENDKYKKRPGSITVNLLAFDEVVATAELSEANDWTFTFENLPKYMIKDGEVGVEIVYSIQEVAVPFYQTEIDGFDITNTYNGPVPEITPPNTGVVIAKNNRNILFEMIFTLLTTSYTIVILKKENE